jgi:hypothetical protein
MRVLLWCLCVAALVLGVVDAAQPGADGPGVGGVPTIPPAKGYFYDFDVLVAGHVDRLGTRQDVETSLEFVNELKSTVADAMQKLDFPSYLRATASTKHRWDRHNDYEKALVDQCYAQLFPKWSARLAGADTYLADNCWAMLESLTVQFTATRRTR